MNRFLDTESMVKDCNKNRFAKALLRELVWGVGESMHVFIQVNILKQHVTK